MDFEFLELLNFTQDEIAFEFEDQPSRGPFATFLYWPFVLAILFVGVFGNSFVCITVFRKRVMQTPVNVILVNLAIVDIIACLSSFLMDHFHEVAGHLFMWKFTCRVVMFIIVLSENFESIIIALPFGVFSFYQHISTRHCSAIILVHWAAAIISAISPAYNTELYTIDEQETSHCIGSLPNSTLGMFFEIFNTVVRILYPFLATTCCLIAHKLQKKRFLNGNSLHRMLFLMVITDIIVWTPFWLLRISNILINTEISYNLYTAMYHLSRFSLIYKPILYILADANFKKEFTALISHCLNRRETENYSLSSVNN